MSQKIITTNSPAAEIAKIADKHDIMRFMLVCDSAFPFLATYEEYAKIAGIAVKFDNFSPNPLYEEVCEGVKLFRESHCDGIIAIGGGSAIDTAKCIRAFSKMDGSKLYLGQKFADSGIPFIAVPTTAGTGSESTRYAVVYYNGEKQSVTDNTLIPDYAILDARNLETLPLYQKKCTVLDALCQGIESWWSVNATPESRELSKKAVELITANIYGYLDNDKKCTENLMTASNLAGQAINITQTTAAHAMSYKLTSLYKIPHGRAAFISLIAVWEYMERNSRNDGELMQTFRDIAGALRCKCAWDGIKYLRELNMELFEDDAVQVNMEDVPYLAASVNVTRLKNNPVKLDEETLAALYKEILEG